MITARRTKLRWPVWALPAAAVVLQGCASTPRPSLASLAVAANCEVREFGDASDGAYRNPILPGDFQNTDVVKVGSDYYYISATKTLSPGMQVLHSRDMVNWTAIGHVVSDITQFSPRFNHDRMEGIQRGVWAGAITHHKGLFYVYFTTPDEGMYVATARNPAGPWSPLSKMIDGPGWDDPAPLWDDDGQGYLVATRFAPDPVTGTTYNIHQFKLTPDGKGLDWSSDQVIYQARGSEASKLYKIGGYYYHYFSEVRTEGRVPLIRRAKSMDGPWEGPRQIIHVSRANGEPNQGSIIETAPGKWVFITHHGTAGWEGRPASLIPVTWIDGWPVAGTVGPDGVGNMVSSAAKTLPGPVFRPQTDDDFSARTLGPQWEWFFQPRADKWSLTERPGYMRLHAFKPLASNDLAKTGNILTQRPLRAEGNVATATLDIRGMEDGQVAGLAMLGRTWASIAVQQDKGERQFVFRQSGRPTILGPVIEPGAQVIKLRMSWNTAGVASFTYSQGAADFSALGQEFQITNFGNYLGAKIGLYTANERDEAGYVDVDAFSYPCGRVGT